MGKTSRRLQKEAHPELAAEVEAIIDGRDPVEVTPADFPALENGFSQATRNSSQDALNVVAAKLPTFLGGSADPSSLKHDLYQD